MSSALGHVRKVAGGFSEQLGRPPYGPHPHICEREILLVRTPPQLTLSVTRSTKRLGTIQRIEKLNEIECGDTLLGMHGNLIWMQ